MAGYVRKLVGHVYNGEYYTNIQLENGMFVEVKGESYFVTPTDGKKDTKLRIRERTSLWGKPALVLDVVSAGEDEIYFVEQDFPPNHDTEWNEAENKIKPGEQVRMKRLLPGEQVIMTVDKSFYNTLHDQQILQPAADGKLEA